MKKIMLLVLFLSMGVFAFADSKDHSSMAAGEGCKDMDCKDMMATHEKMMADVKAMDAKLDEMVAAMNSASGDKKVDAMGALVTEMVSQRKQMQEMMMTMMHSMHSMHAMQSGCSGMDTKDKMACCSGDKKMECCSGDKPMPCCSGDKKDKN